MRKEKIEKIMSKKKVIDMLRDCPQCPKEVKAFQSFHRRVRKTLGWGVFIGGATSIAIVGLQTHLAIMENKKLAVLNQVGQAIDILANGQDELKDDSIEMREKLNLVSEKQQQLEKNQEVMLSNLENGLNDLAKNQKDLAENQQGIVDHQGLLREEVQSVINYIKENGKASMKHSTDLDNALRRFIVSESDLIIKKIGEKNGNLMEELSQIMQEQPQVFDDEELQKKLEDILNRLLLVLLRQDKLYENTHPDKWADINVKLKDVIDYLKIQKGLSGTTPKLPSEGGSNLGSL